MTRDRAGVEATLAGSATTKLPGGAAPSAVVPADTESMSEKAAAENFPVALRMLPRRYRDHLMAVYTFARTVDDAGDEGPLDQRDALLAALDTDLGLLYAGGPAEPADPAVRGLAPVVTGCGIPIQPFRDLIRANQQDQVVSRYETFDDLLGYCRLSADPVGQIVLLVFGASNPARVTLSDQVCSGLQVVEHLQDVAEDYQAGRIYLPAQDMRQYGCTEQDLAGPTTPARLRQLIAFEASRADALVASGSRLVGQLRGFARVAVAGYIAGGRAALAALAAADYDVLTATPHPSKSRTVRELASTVVRGR